MESLAAQPRQISLMLRLPNALPYLFNALKLGSTLAVIGVIVTEYFGGQAMRSGCTSPIRRPCRASPKHGQGSS